MVFASATDTGSLMVFGTETDAVAYCEGIDVENGEWRFWDSNGQGLAADFLTPNYRNGIVVGSGTYRLVAAPDLPALAHALTAVSALETNPHFATLQEVRIHLQAMSCQPHMADR